MDGPGFVDYPLRAFGRSRTALVRLLERLGVDWEISEPEAAEAS